MRIVTEGKRAISIVKGLAREREGCRGKQRVHAQNRPSMVVKRKRAEDVKGNGQKGQQAKGMSGD